MMESSSEDEHDAICVDRSNELLFLAKELCVYPEILGKSQLPKAKKKKEDALKKVLEKYQASFGMLLDLKVLLKKINNMKTRLKKKTDTNQTGNKKIILLEWERKMLEAIRGESNPVVQRIPGAIQCGVKHSADKTKSPDSLSPSTSQIGLPVLVEAEHNTKVSRPLPPQKETAIDQFETEVTKKLDNKQLQRLVLLQQLKTAQVQEEYFKEKLKMLQQKNYINVPFVEAGPEGDLSFITLQ